MTTKGIQAKTNNLFFTHVERGRYECGDAAVQYDAKTRFWHVEGLPSLEGEQYETRDEAVEAASDAIEGQAIW